MRAQGGAAMKRTLFAILVLLLAVGVLVAQDEEETSEPQEQALRPTPYLSVMPSYYLGDVRDREFDAYQFWDGKKLVTVEGRIYWSQYWLKEGALQSSELQILRNYATAVRTMGGTVFLEGYCEGDACGDKSVAQRVSALARKGDTEVWIEVMPFNDGHDYDVTIVERQVMRQAVTASGLMNALQADGRVALYINFDTNKAVIKDDSRPVLDQVAALLGENPSLKLSVEGHTDNTGTPERNKTLSLERAKAVVAALTAAGIDAKRLATAGWGQEKPLADNGTEEGRAKNRRVELVKK